ncbi:MAG: hypothetical protein ACXWLM_01760 [Myxococcales bacterium]
MLWTRPRIALIACAGLSALAMLYAGLFQVGILHRLACPVFGAGCESVALAPFAWPLGFADGLLLAALAGLVCALAQVQRKEAASALVGLAFLDVLVNLILLFEMQRFHAWDFWTVLAALLSLPIAGLAVSCSRTAAAVVPDDRPQQQQ